MQAINGNGKGVGSSLTRKLESNGEIAVEANSPDMTFDAASWLSGRPAEKHAGGRPTKRTPERTARIAEAISFGLTDEEAALPELMMIL